MTTKFLGIDPGLKGALVFLTNMIVTAYPMPVYKRGDKTYVDESELTRIVSAERPDQAVIEDVFSSPQMGVVSAFSFGEGKGVLKGVLAGQGVPFVLVSPAKWKSDMGTIADKNHTKRLARSVFKNQKLSTEGKCEAALLALWLKCSRQNQN